MIRPERKVLLELLEPEVEQLGFELAYIEALFDSRPGILRLFIDKEAGITLDDCAAVSRQVSAVLDVEDPIPGDYNLEVSSPGMNRQLVKPEHFEKFVGQQVKIKLKRALNERRNFKAKLLGLEAEQILLEEEKQRFKIPLQEIDTARLVPEL